MRYFYALLIAAVIAIPAFFGMTNDFGAGGGAVCGTDAQCAEYSRSIGETPSGYAEGK
jgi:hypothetical protein